MGAKVRIKDADIAQSGTTSTAVYIGNGCLVGVYMSQGWDAASITFEAAVETTDGVAPDGATAGQEWHPIAKADGSTLTLTSPAAGEFIAIGDELEVRGASWLRLVASAAQTTAARTLRVAVMD